MHEETLRRQTHPPLAETIYTLFVRLMAAYCLVVGTYYWVRLIGIYPGLFWRFDLMPWPWQAACVGLAILMPVAATGLWLRAAWGPVLWIAGALAEILIYGYLDRIFESRPWVVAFNTIAILIFILLRCFIFWKKRQMRKPVYETGF